MRYFIVSLISFAIALFFLIYGFYKMFVYETAEVYYEKSVNSYVGGDAYNYIINANYATGFFILALTFTVIGCTFLLIHTFDKKI